MKRNGKLLVLLAVMAVLIAAAVIITGMNFNSEETEDTNVKYTIFQVKYDDVTAFSWTYKGETMAFSKEGEVWSLTEDSAFPVNGELLNRIVKAGCKLTASKTLEGVADLSEFGLTEPKCALTLTANGTTTQILLGDENTMGGSVYASIGDGKVYLVSDNVPEKFAYSLYDLLQMEKFPVVYPITAFKVEAKTHTLEIRRLKDSGLAYSDQYKWFVGKEAVDTELAESMMDYITKLKWESCANYHADDKALESYGLDTPAAVVTAEYTDTEGNAAQFALEIGNYLEESKKYYARLPGSSMVYLISANVGKAMLNTTQKELMPDEVLLMDFDELTGLDMILDGVAYHVDITVESVTDEKGPITEKTVYTLNGKPVKLESVLLDISGLVSAGYAADLTPERKEEIRFIFYRDHETFPAVELAFYQHDSANCLTQLLGKSTVLVKRSKIVDLVEKVSTILLADSQS